MATRSDRASLAALLLGLLAAAAAVAVAGPLALMQRPVARLRQKPVAEPLSPEMMRKLRSSGYSALTADERASLAGN